MTLSQDIKTHGLECPNCPGENRRVHDRLIEQCPKCGAEAYPIKDLPEPVDVELYNLRKDEE